MTRMDRYVLGEMLQPLLAGIMMILVTLIGNTLYNYIEQILKTGIPFKVVFRLIVFNIPALIPLVLPAATALASAWCINRLARDSEITPIRMSGVSLRRLFMPIFAWGIVASGISFVVSDRVVPWSQREFLKTQGEIGVYTILAAPSVATNRVFTFQDYAFHIRQIQKDPGGDPNKLRLDGVTIFQNSASNGFPTLITAKSASYNNYVWTLYDAVTHTLASDGFTQVEVAAKQMTLNLHVPLSSLAQSAFESPDQLSMQELGEQMRALSKTGQDYAAVAYNYYAKLAVPFMCLAFALVTPPLTIRYARSGTYSGIFISLILVWIAWNTLLLMRYLGDSGRLQPIVAAWAPDLLFAIIGLWMLRRVE